MEIVFEDNKKRQIIGREEISIPVKIPGLYLLVVTARVKGEKEVGGTDDEDLRVEIDGRKFSKAAFSGGKTKNLQNINGGLLYFQWLLGLYKGQQDQLEKTLAAWNWGMANFPTEGPFDFKRVPKETRDFINFILQR